MTVQNWHKAGRTSKEDHTMLTSVGATTLGRDDGRVINFTLQRQTDRRFLRIVMDRQEAMLLRDNLTKYIESTK